MRAMYKEILPLLNNNGNETHDSIVNCVPRMDNLSFNQKMFVLKNIDEVTEIIEEGSEEDGVHL